MYGCVPGKLCCAACQESSPAGMKGCAAGCSRPGDGICAGCMRPCTQHEPMQLCIPQGGDADYRGKTQHVRMQLYISQRADGYHGRMRREYLGNAAADGKQHGVGEEALPGVEQLLQGCLGGRRGVPRRHVHLHAHVLLKEQGTSLLCTVVGSNTGRGRTSGKLRAKMET